jgi:hypothetical protein
LIDGEARPPLFQGSFVGHEKWFRGPWVHPDEERAPVGGFSATKFA